MVRLLLPGAVARFADGGGAPSSAAARATITAVTATGSPTTPAAPAASSATTPLSLLLILILATRRIQLNYDACGGDEVEGIPQFECGV